MHRAFSIADAVISRVLPAEEDFFAELSASVRMEDVGKGRRGAVLTRVGEDGAVPLVRSTTRYGDPPQPFGALQDGLARRVRDVAGLPGEFDNALIESYTNAYKRMGGHSDQALDLADGSFIAVFSCYEHPEAGPPRKLIFAAKEDGAEEYEFPLAHNSVVVFSVDANRLLRHKIVLDAPGPVAENRWLGVTFRSSKTLLRFRDGHPYLPQGDRLTLADEEQSREFYRLRRRENEETDFVYPVVTYTVSASDLSPPVALTPGA